MGKNEIRLRRQMFSAGRIAQHRNYQALVDRHYKEMKMRRITRIFIYLILILFVLITIFWLGKMQQQQPTKEQNVPAQTSARPQAVSDAAGIPR